MTNQAWVPEVGGSVKTRDKINPREHVVIAIDGDMAWIKLAYQKQRGQLYPLEQLTPWPTDEDNAVDKCFQCHGEGKAEWQSGYTTQLITCPLCLGTGVSVDYFIEQITAKIEAKYRKQPEPAIKHKVESKVFYSTFSNIMSGCKVWVDCGGGAGTATVTHVDWHGMSQEGYPEVVQAQAVENGNEYLINYTHISGGYYEVSYEPVYRP